MNFLKDPSSCVTEADVFKYYENSKLSLPSTQCRVQLNSEDTCQYKSFYSACSPLQDYSQRFSNTSEVFDRLAVDVNRRCDKRQKLNEFLTELENKSMRKYVEKEEVYDRLLKDTQQRRERRDLKETFREQEMENTARTFRTDKTCSKEEADAIVKRLVCESYLGSPRRNVEQEYASKKQNDLNRFLSAGNMKVKQNYKGNKDLIDIVERTEIEQRYGKPGKPPNAVESKKVILRKGSDVVKKSNTIKVDSKITNSTKTKCPETELRSPKTTSSKADTKISTRSTHSGFFSAKKPNS